MATVDVVVPCYNEEGGLANTVARTLVFLDDHPEHEWRVVIADNASTDRTLKVARELETRHRGRVAALHIPTKGRGIALRTAWLGSAADVATYMDVDLSTDLAHLPELVDPLARGEADVSFGTRLHHDSETERGWRREFISRSYVFLLNHLARLRVSDAQCGFKAIRTDVGREILPLVRDNAWFFDSELLLVAQENGLRLLEIPVRWTDDPDSRVAIVQTALDDLRGMWRLRRGGVPRITARPER